MEKTNTEKITNEMLAGLSENSSESFDVESGNEEVEDQSWRLAMLFSGSHLLSKGRSKQ
jgi:hypothetical protein